jgi:protein phosphatase
LEDANHQIYAMSHKSSQLNEMSTTIVLAFFQLPTIYICHAGDSRAYLFNDKQITRLTEDDVWVTSGKLRNVLTKAIGQEHSLEPTFSEVSVSTGDWLLLCSDGLWDMLKDEQIQAIFQQSETPADFANLLVSAANDAGGLDNISVVVVKVI